MKTLSVRPVGAWLIVNGHKPIENRTWLTSYRGPLLIHASQKLDWNDIYDAREICERLGVELPREVDCGGIVGMVDLVDVVQYSKSPWFAGPYGFVLENPRAVEFVDYRGKLGLFDVEWPR